jgi:hypothetical protein
MLENLAKLTGSTAVAVERKTYETEPETASAVIVFSEGTRLTTYYWRLIKNNKALTLDVRWNFPGTVNLPRGGMMNASARAAI